MKTKKQFDQAFPVQVNLPIQWGDMDAFGHVNNIMYFRYFETARLAYFKTAGVLDDMENIKIGPILAETQAQYKRALVYPDQIIVGASVSENQEYGFLMQYGIYSEGQQQVTTQGLGRIVMIDYLTSQKVKPSSKLLRMIAEIQNKK